MKNIWFMLLTVCTMFAFSACSDDDEKNPTNPVADAKVPATIQIGEEMIITGTGFTAPGIALYLEDSEKDRTKLEATFSAAGATCTVPELTPGTFSIILTQEGHEWKLGETALTVGPNPIISPALPEGIVYIGKQITIGGSGYAATDKISLQAEEGEAIEITEVTVTEGGLQFTLPEDLAAGIYTVSLVRGVQSWTLEGTLDVQKEKRIKSISIESMLGGMNFELTYNNKQVSHLKITVGEDELQYDFHYEENRITTESQINAISPLEFTLRNEKIVQSTACQSEYDSDKYNTWNYDSRNYLSGINNPDEDYYGMDIPFISYNAEGNLEKLSIRYMFDYTYSYDAKAIDAIPNTLDLALAPHLFMMIFYQAGEDVALGLLANQHGYSSNKIPTKINYVGLSGNNEEYSITTQWTNNYTLEIVCEDETIGTTTIVYEDIE